MTEENQEPPAAANVRADCLLGLIGPGCRIRAPVECVGLAPASGIGHHAAH